MTFSTPPNSLPIDSSITFNYTSFNIGGLLGLRKNIIPLLDLSLFSGITVVFDNLNVNRPKSIADRDSTFFDTTISPIGLNFFLMPGVDLFFWNNELASFRISFFLKKDFREVANLFITNKGNGVNKISYDPIQYNVSLGIALLGHAINKARIEEETHKKELNKACDRLLKNYDLFEEAFKAKKYTLALNIYSSMSEFRKSCQFNSADKQNEKEMKRFLVVQQHRQIIIDSMIVEVKGIYRQINKTDTAAIITCLQKIGEYPEEVLKIAKPKYEQLLDNLRAQHIFAEAQKLHSIDQYKMLLEKYPNSPLMTEARDSMVALQKTQNQLEERKMVDQILAPYDNLENAIKQCSAFINNNPSSKYISEVISRRDQLVSILEDSIYTQAIRENNPDKYQSFILQYPKSKYINDVNERYQKLILSQYNQVIKSSDPEVYQAFLSKYPESKYVDDINKRFQKLQDKIAAKAARAEKEAEAKTAREEKESEQNEKVQEEVERICGGYEKLKELYEVWNMRLHGPEKPYQIIQLENAIEKEKRIYEYNTGKPFKRSLCQ